MDCDLSYLDQTSKELNTRINKRKYSVRTGQTNNALFLHLSKKSHRIHWMHSQILSRCNETISWNLLESVLILLPWQNNSNVSQGLFSFDPVIKPVLEGIER